MQYLLVLLHAFTIVLVIMHDPEPIEKQNAVDDGGEQVTGHPPLFLLIIQEVKQSELNILSIETSYHVQEGLSYQEHRYGNGQQPGRRIVVQALVEQRIAQEDEYYYGKSHQEFEESVLMVEEAQLAQVQSCGDEERVEALVEVHLVIVPNVAFPVPLLLRLHVDSQVDECGEQARVENYLADHFAEVVSVPDHQTRVANVAYEGNG